MLLNTMKGKEPLDLAGAELKNSRCFSGSDFVCIVSLCILNGELNLATELQLKMSNTF